MDQPCSFGQYRPAATITAQSSAKVPFAAKAALVVTLAATVYKVQDLYRHPEKWQDLKNKVRSLFNQKQFLKA